MLREVKEGKARFEPEDLTPASIERFQGDAKRLVDANARGYFVRFLPQMGADRAQLYYRAVSVIGGLTFPGEQYLSEHLDEDPGTPQIREKLRVFESPKVAEAWEKALDRISSDPSGAITAAKSLLEGTFKSILKERGQEPEHSEDFSRLWRKVAKELSLDLDPREADPMKKLLGACNALVGALAEVRNQSGDAHGGSDSRVAAVHARLAVHVAGAFAAFVAEIHASNSKT